MNWEAVGAIGELVGSLVVLLTLIYLAIQVKHSGRTADITAASLLASTWSNFQSRMSQNESLARAMSKALAGERLENHEIVMIRGWLAEYVEVVNNECDLVEDGIVDAGVSEESLQGLRDTVKGVPLFNAILNKSVTNPKRRERIFGSKGT